MRNAIHTICKVVKCTPNFKKRPVSKICEETQVGHYLTPEYNRSQKRTLKKAMSHKKIEI